MGWDATKPGDTVKIRSIAGEIRTNWDAIEQGLDAGGTALKYYTIQLANRSLIVPPVAANPTTDSTIFHHFSKSDGVNVEWYTKSPTGTVTQMSRGDPVVAASGSTYLPGGLLLKWGTASIPAAAGTTDVTFNTQFTTAVYSVVVTERTTSASTDRLGSINAASGLDKFVWRNATALAYTIHYMAIGV